MPFEGFLKLLFPEVVPVASRRLPIFPQRPERNGELRLDVDAEGRLYYGFHGLEHLYFWSKPQKLNWLDTAPTERWETDRASFMQVRDGKLAFWCCNRPVGHVRLDDFLRALKELKEWHTANKNSAPR